MLSSIRSTLSAVAQQMPAEIIRANPEKVVGRVGKPVALAGDDEDVEPLIRLDQRVSIFAAC